MNEKQTLRTNFKSSLLSSTALSQSYFRINVIERYQDLSSLYVHDFVRSQALYKNKTYLGKRKVVKFSLFLRYKEILIQKCLNNKKILFSECHPIRK
jgi:hypothetical protein